MKLLLDRISNLANGELKKSVYEYDDEQTALGNTYVYFGTDIKDDNVLSVNCLLHATNGEIKLNLYNQKTPKVEVPTEEVTE